MRLYKSPGEGYLYAGTTDLVAKMDNEIWLLDWKTGKKPKPKIGYKEWGLQTASYRNADGRPTRNGVIHLDKETGGFTFYDYSDTYEQDIVGFKLLAHFWHNRHPDKDGLPSSTTITGLLDKSGPLTHWAANCACDFIIERIDESIPYKDTLGIIELARKNFRSVSQKAMNIGSMVHEAIEIYLKEGIEPPKNTRDEVLAGFVAFLEFAEEHTLEVLDIEKIVYGKE